MSLVVSLFYLQRATVDTYPILVMLFLLFFPTHLAHSSGWRWGASDSISLRARVGSLPNYYHTLVPESGLRVKFLYIREIVRFLPPGRPWDPAGTSQDSTQDRRACNPRSGHSSGGPFSLLSR